MAIYETVDRYVERVAALDPVAATFMGVTGHDREMTDYSPEGAAALHALSRETLAALNGLPEGSDRDRVAKECAQDLLGIGIQHYDAGEHYLGLNILGSPLQHVRMVFDLMPRETPEDWGNIAARLRLVPDSLRSYQAMLDEGVRRGLTVARRQVLQCIRQVEAWTGAKGGQPFFPTLLDSYVQSGLGDKALRADLERGIGVASSGYDALGRFLEQAYLPHAREKDAVGRERYRLNSLSYNGIELDFEETYAWGWEQLRWVESEMATTANRILPGGTVQAAKELLENDPSRAIEGVEAFRQWMQDLQDRTIAELDGTHFDLAAPVKRIEAMIAPPGGALAMYYTGPSEDFSRPGRTWYPTGGKTRFPLWGEVSIAYHEGVPGHHFQIATAKSLRDSLSRFQRLLAGDSGYAEGWALYAERLMADLGYLANPDYYLGMLRAQALRTVRVIVDIGMHLELRTPADQIFAPGAVWTPELALEFVKERSHFPAAFMESEINRYLGMPGQAISYKVGEREWLGARDEAKRRHGPGFDLKAWHNRALDLGPMGLAQMKREMSRTA